jgi:hypothetical protein
MDSINLFNTQPDGETCFAGLEKHRTQTTSPKLVIGDYYRLFAKTVVLTPENESKLNR